LAEERRDLAPEPRLEVRVRQFGFATPCAPGSGDLQWRRGLIGEAHFGGGEGSFVRPPASTALSFCTLQWLFPVAITIHNLEEPIWLPGFLVAHGKALPWTDAPGEFRFDLVVLTAAAWVVTYLSWCTGSQSIWAYLLYGYIVAMLVNVFVPHVPAAIVFRGYAPGVVTAVVVNFPVLALLSLTRQGLRP